MSSKLKKKSKQFRFVQSRYNPSQEQQDKLIVAAADKVTFATYLILKDDFGFKFQKLQNFFKASLALKASWRDGKSSTEDMLVWCNKKGIDVYGWVKKMSLNKKMMLIRPNKLKGNPAETVKLIDSVIILVLMISVIILKEQYKFSNEKIEKLLTRLEEVTDLMTTLQPAYTKPWAGQEETFVKKRTHAEDTPYLTEEDIIQIFRNDLQLDLVTGERWKVESK